MFRRGLKTAKEPEEPKHEEMARRRSRCHASKGKKSSPLRSVSKLHRRRQRTRSVRRRARSRKRRPLPAFFLFMKDHRPQLKCNHPDWDVIQIAKRLGVMWHQQSCEDQEKYKKEAARLRQANRGGRQRKACGRRQKKRRKKRTPRKKSPKKGCKSLTDGLGSLACC